MQSLAPDDPARIGPYRLLSRLGAGGMGRVYLAREADAGPGATTVAVKLIRTDPDAEQSEFRRRFTREVAAARRVSGAWTARVLDADTDAEQPWVATEYVPGPTLRAVVRGDFGALPSASAHVLAHRLAQALDAIHGAGLVHRDLKPSNILLTVDGPRVIDFGVSQVLDATVDSSLTGTGTLVGTPEFMSPEQVRGERVTPAGDVFSLGSVLAYAATGRSPFQGAGEGGLHAQLFRIAYEEPDLTGVPEVIADLVRRCLAKHPDDRPTVPELIDLTLRAPAGAWLPASLLARLDRVAAQPLPETPHRGEPTPEPPRFPEFPELPEFPDLPELPDLPEEPAAAERRDPLDVPEAGIAPPHVIRTPPAPRVPRFGGRAAGVLLPVLAVLSVVAGGYVVLPTLVATPWSALGDHPRERAPGYYAFGGTWRVTRDEDGPLLSMRLGLVQGARTGRPGATVVSATRDTICTGEAMVRSRSENTLVLGDFRMHGIGTGSSGKEICGVPHTMRLRAEEGQGLSWVYSRGMSYGLEPASEDTYVSLASRGDWYSADGGLRITVGTRRLGQHLIHGSDDHGGRHCEWEAALLDARENTFATTVAHVIAERSDPLCRPASVAYDYTLHGSGTAATLTRHSRAETATLRLERHP
ncbi:serine/threonine-protein kinase [Streptomyces sp. NPDC059468]|uniref:serine/threonine-protein kinase n=1 Tax=Streptomyces sp. NPDC059468 TaxID=3346845 RepID=UPI00369A7E92